MNGKKELFIILLFIALSSVFGYASDVVVERPIYSSGDQWTFIGEKGTIIRLAFLREEKDKYIFSSNGTEVVKDFSLRDVTQTRGFPGPIIKFPLKVGDWWNYEYTEELATASGSGQRIVRYNAADFEKITVPAGTFNAFKITATIDAALGKKGYKKIGSATYWYAPDVKQIIKAEKGELLWELKEYKVK